MFQYGILTFRYEFSHVSDNKVIHLLFYRLLDASLTASGSRDCSLKMAFILSQVKNLYAKLLLLYCFRTVHWFYCSLTFHKCMKVALTCMAKLRDERFQSPGPLSTDTVSYLDIVTLKQLSNGACHSILFKLIIAILRNESSEALRRRYSLLCNKHFYTFEN